MVTELPSKEIKPSNITFDEDGTTYHRNGYKIQLPESGSIDDGYHEHMAYYINRILDEIEDVFGEKCIHPFFVSESFYDTSRVLYADEDFIVWKKNLHESKKDYPIGSPGYRAKNVNSMTQTLFNIDFRGTYFYVTGLNNIFYSFLDEGQPASHKEGNVYLDTNEFLKVLQSMKKSIADTFLLAGEELTSVKQQRFVSLLFEKSLFENFIIKQIVGLTPDIPMEKDPKLALLASKGHSASLLKLFYVYTYFPSYVELEDMNTLPFEWIVNILGSKS
jgi:hypothetical protein